MTATVRYDLPTPDATSEPWWAALREERLLFSRCAACRNAFLYVRDHCPRCWSGDVMLEQASGWASLYTWSVVHRNDLPPFGDRVPYVAAVVELAEGPRLMTVVEGCAPEDLVAAMPLQVAFRVQAENLTVPVFVPAG